MYALKVAVDHGYIAASFLPVAARGWQGPMSEVKQDAKGPRRRTLIRAAAIRAAAIRKAVGHQGPAPGPLLQYSENRLPVALKARPDVAAAAQGAVLET